MWTVEGDDYITVQGVIPPRFQSEDLYEPDVVVPSLMDLHYNVNKVLKLLTQPPRPAPRADQ